MIRTARTKPLSALRAALLATLLAAPVVMTAPTIASAATPTDLFISEYVEGSSFNKAIEIFNGTGAAVDLSTYTLELYSNGSATVSQSLTLSGSLADGDVFVAAHPSADTAILDQADVTNGSVVNWNGDDAIVLQGAAGVVDSFGQVGVDPGSEWPGGGQDDTLRRMASVCAGDTDPSDAFDASVEYDVFAQNTFDGLGAHTADCGPAGPTDLFISEYVEGSSFNKAIEIFNGTGAAVDLSTYTLELYSNGSATVSQSLTLSGSLADGDVFVAAHPSADTAILDQADVTNGSVVNWNGDDAIVLQGAAGVVDSFGQVGVDPGSEWPGGGQDDTLRRMASVCAGDTDPSDAFDASVEYDVFAQNTFDGLGAHSVNCVENAALIIDCGPDLVVDEGVGGATTVSASDADDTVVAMNLVTDDVAPAGSLTAGTFTASGAPGDPATLELNLDGLAAVGVYSATVQAENASGETVSCDLAIEVESTEVTITKIHDVQGAGAASPLVGDTVIIEGIVVGDFQDGASGTNGDLNGFHVQEEDADADADANTSEGIFVFNGSSPAVNVQIGDLVQVEGAVSEFNGLTEITSFTGVSVLSSGNPLPTAASLSLPVTEVDDFESSEGMLVTFPQELVISEYFNFDRFNETVLTSQRNLTPTAEVEPGPDAIAEAANYALDRITLDDGRTNQNPDPAIHPNGGVFDLDNLFRGGDTLANVTGVMDYSFGLYRIQPTQGADYTNTNVRTAAPDPVGGRLQVATFNVLNYFTTIDDGVNDICGPAGNQECRGADNATELTRQRDKIIAAIAAIDADVVGLIEIENNVTDGPTADLVAGLNDAMGAGTYDYVATGAIGTDAIRTALIYKPASVTPSGEYAVLDSSVDPRFNDDKSRPVLAQTFVENATGGAVTVAVNHFKSKGSSCDDVSDPDLGEGAGNCNLTRTAAAEALVDWLATDPTDSGDTDLLIVGDLNSYDKEDPIDVIIGAGYTDLIADGLGEDAYSYVFDGQIGYLDYQLSSESLTPQVTRTTVWHINADEPDLIDYDTSFKRDAQDAIYAPDPYRSSDHDPVIVGLDLDFPAPDTARSLKEAARDELAAAAPTGSTWKDTILRWSADRIDRSLDTDWWLDDSYLDPQNGQLVFVNEKIAASLLGQVGDVAPEAQSAIDKLIAADALLANKALDVAIATDGDARDIARAQEQLSNADDDIARGRYDKAIDHYRRAWRFAVQAVKDTRFATYNASLNRNNEGDLVRELAVGGSAQPATIAEIIQRNRPEVLLINEFDYDAAGLAAKRFQQNYLSVSQNGADPISYPFRYVAPSNTGIYSGFDLDNSGAAGDFVPNDSFGFGFFPGQFGMVVYSMHPIDVDGVRTFQNFLWKDMPGALLPDDPTTAAPADWYSPEELEVFRLSSKSHWDVPIWVGDRKVHFLVSHPTPPVFDGDEDRNGTRNFDEIRFWADYVRGGSTASYIYDDAGAVGGLGASDRFVIAGDQNSDPLDGDSIPGAIQQLLDSPRVNTTVTPESLGGPEQAALQGGINDVHLSDPRFDTADFADGAPGNLRADYVLPSKRLKITDAAVYWPETTDPEFPLVGTFPFPSSDHRLVWVDVVV